ncbi:hypothetical protein RSOLAG22IIIB_13935 [Rhizoctonia solani]|uniref:Uncharacterized protein n=1 Tax=Rhizoctonia solani TaxID=456999 RepID=A0A0K6FSX3_9AGAM|nr:hypothetical protein RSOLAG22IIIB_13935 [Rhizoctonia solani]
MTAFAGFYVMNSNPNRRPGAFGETAAQDLIIEALREQKVEDYFYVQIVPVPPSEPDYEEDALGMMLVRRKEKKRAYIAQRLDSTCDLAGRKIIKQYFGLEVSVWKTLWFNEESSEAPYEAEFLKPVASTKKGKAKKPRNKTKDNVTAGRKHATGGEEGGESGNQVGKGAKEDKGDNEGAQVEYGKVEVEGQETKL